MAAQTTPVQYLSQNNEGPHQTMEKQQRNHTSSTEDHQMKTVSPIGYIQSCFKSKNGTPRQPSVCTFSRAKLQVLKSVFVCPDHSLQGLEQFSHVWIVFLFHKNGPPSFTKAKVKPPRLNGAKVGLFATRSPHRPNPIGLTLAKLDKVQGGTLYLSGVDIIEGTPILDVKPYVPAYDNPLNILSAQKSLSRLLEDEDFSKQENSKAKQEISETVACELRKEENQITRISNGPHDTNEVNFNVQIMSNLDSSSNEQLITKCTRNLDTTQMKDNLHLSSNEDGNPSQHTQQVSTSSVPDDDDQASCNTEVKVAEWITSPPISKLQVEFTEKAQRQLSAFHPITSKEINPGNYSLEFFKDTQEAKKAICEILEADPRSTYRREKCSDRLYYFAVDTVHVTCWFYDDIAEVIRIQPLCQADIHVSK